VITLGGCAPWTQLKGQEYKFHAGGFKAQVPRDWMKANTGFFLMTRDGLALNEVSVKRYRFKDKLEHTAKRFFPQMLPQDLVEVEQDNFRANANITGFEIIRNEPRTIHGQDGYLIEYTFSTMRGLTYHGIQSGFAYDEKVYRIRYEAPQQHYYETALSDFDTFLETFRLLKKEQEEKKLEKTKKK